MGRFLRGFQYQMARRLTERLPWRQEDGNWEYTSSEAAISEAGFETMGTYIRQSQNIFTQCIVMISLLDLYKATERKQEKRVGMRW